MPIGSVRMSALHPPIAGRSNTANGPPGEFQRRLPAVTVAATFAVGILCDHLVPAGAGTWIVLGGLAWGLWLALLLCQRTMGYKGSRLASGTEFGGLAALLLALAASGGAWHHLRWSAVGPNEIARFATQDPAPVRLRGRIADRPVRLPRRETPFTANRPRRDRWQCQLECKSLVSLDSTLVVTGRCRLEVEGELSHVAADDLVDVVGVLSRPSGPANPGGFDYRSFLRIGGIHCTLRCNEAEDVRLVVRGTAFWRRGQAALRSRAESLLSSNLSSTTAPVGTALLLGTRTAIPEDLRIAFAESGTMHILAISGANVAILAGLLWGVARILSLGRGKTALWIVAGVGAYAFVADSQPPVLRAMLMVLAVASGQAWHRRGAQANGLGLAVLGVLIWNPAHLFDTGAQLSFLAVAALIWSPTLMYEWWGGRPGVAPLDRLERRFNVWRRLRGWLYDQLRVSIVTLAAIWLFTLPLTTARFHLVSPVGFAANVVLAPIAIVVLWAGYLLLTIGLIVPAAGPVLGLAYDAGLRLLIGTVEASAAVPLGHFYLPGPSEFWLAVCYGLLGLLLFGAPGSWLRAVGWRGLLTWCVAGLGWSLWPADNAELRCTFLSVGHGLAVLVELPDGRTVVYDVGQMDNGPQARNALQTALWQRGKSRIDALVLSHSDVDHFNGVPGLARILPLGGVFVHSSFLDFSELPVRETCDDLARARVPIRLVWEGDRLALDSNATIEVLHPARGRTYTTDNASSLVLIIKYRGRRILLTGDLEQRGLKTLLDMDPQRVDILQAPHHGSLSANPAALARWSQPAWVIVSGSRRDGRGGLPQVYGSEATILSTHDCGAITFVIDREGDLRFESIRPVHRE